MSDHDDMDGEYRIAYGGRVKRDPPESVQEISWTERPEEPRRFVYAPIGSDGDEWIQSVWMSHVLGEQTFDKVAAKMIRAVVEA